MTNSHSAHHSGSRQALYHRVSQMTKGRTRSTNYDAFARPQSLRIPLVSISGHHLKPRHPTPAFSFLSRHLINLTPEPPRRVISSPRGFRPSPSSLFSQWRPPLDDLLLVADPGRLG